MVFDGVVEVVFIEICLGNLFNDTSTLVLVVHVGLGKGLLVHLNGLVTLLSTVVGIAIVGVVEVRELS